MPYIAPSLRPKLDEALSQLEYTTGLTVGELNYFITRLVVKWLGDSPGYTRYSAVRGVLQDVSDELYRRVVATYEDRKCAENGDVY